MDVLSEIFSALRLKAGLYFSTCIRGDFAIHLAAEQRRIRFHLVLEGVCVVTVPGQNQIRLAQGDLVLIPDGAPQTLSSGADISATVDLADVMSRTPPVDGVLEHGVSGQLCRILCGFLRFDEALDHPILNSLPPVIVLPRSDDPGSGEEPETTGVDAALALLRAEAGRPGAGQASIVLRVVEILLMQMARSTLARQKSAMGGFSTALAHPKLAKALRMIHSGPDRQWNVNNLAEVAGMSRSRFAHRFTQTVGLTPIAYLTQWRMIKARELLVEPGLDMADIAELCGYLSVPAFGRRFAATFGIGPGEWRKRNLAFMQHGLQTTNPERGLRNSRRHLVQSSPLG